MKVKERAGNSRKVKEINCVEENPQRNIKPCEAVGAGGSDGGALFVRLLQHMMLEHNVILCYVTL